MNAEAKRREATFSTAQENRLVDALAAGEDLDGPEARPKRKVLDATALSRRAGRIITHQTPVFFAGRQTFGDPSRLPIFLVGLATPTAKRIRTILSAHSSVHGARPLDLLPLVVEAMEAWDKEAQRARQFPESLDGLTAEDSVRVAGWLLHSMQKEDPGAEHILDGRGLDAGLVGLVHLVFPQAGLLITRDEVDPDTLADGPRQLWHAQKRLIDHWKQVLPGRLFEVGQSELQHDPEKTTRAMLEHLGLTWEERLAQAFHSDATPPMASLSPGTAISTAVAHMRAGRAEPAEKLLLAVLKRVPEHPAAIHLLGVIRFRQGQPQKAADLMRRSLVLAGTPMGDWQKNLEVVEAALARRTKPGAPAPAPSSASARTVGSPPNKPQAAGKSSADSTTSPQEGEEGEAL